MEELTSRMEKQEESILQMKAVIQEQNSKMAAQQHQITDQQNKITDQQNEIEALKKQSEQTGSGTGVCASN